MLLGEAIGVTRGQAEDLPEFDELLAGLKQTGRVPTSVPIRRAAETNVELLQRTFTENGWGELTHSIKARIVLNLTDSWWKGTVPAPATIARAKALIGYVNARFRKLGSVEAAPAKAGS